MADDLFDLAAGNLFVEMVVFQLLADADQGQRTAPGHHRAEQFQVAPDRRPLAGLARLQGEGHGSGAARGRVEQVVLQNEGKVGRRVADGRRGGLGATPAGWASGPWPRRIPSRVAARLPQANPSRATSANRQPWRYFIRQGEHGTDRGLHSNLS